jgi:hypothetical protein
MKRTIQNIVENLDITPRTILITGFLSGVGIDPEGTKLLVVEKIIEFLRIGDNSGASRFLNIILVMLELFFILITVIQLFRTEPIGWVCALLGFFSGFTSANIYLGLLFLALGIFVLRFT